MPKLTVILFACCLLLMPVSAKTAEPAGKLDMEKYELLLSYVSFINFCKNMICTPRDDPGFMQEMYDYSDAWMVTFNPKLSNNESGHLIDFFSSANQKDMDALFSYYKTPSHEINSYLLRNMQFCARLTELDDLSIKMFKREFFSSEISNEDYVLMNYTSFIAIWSFAMFNDKKLFNSPELIGTSIQYFDTNNIDTKKYYISMIDNEVSTAKKFINTAEELKFNMRTYMSATQLFQRWRELDKQAYEFFSKRVAK